MRANTFAKRGDMGTSCGDNNFAIFTYPCCPKEKLLFGPGMGGWASVKCPNCGKFILFDFSRGSSSVVKARRGATKSIKRSAMVPLS